MLSVTDPRGHITRPLYDRAYRSIGLLSNLSTGTPSSNASSLNTFDILSSNLLDPNGNILVATDGNGNITRNHYDALNRLTITTTNPLNGNPTNPNTNNYTPALTDIVVHNEYDDAGNLTLVTDGEEQKTAFRYDGLARKTHTLWDPDTPVMRTDACVFDGVLKVSSTNPKGEVINHGYDGQHRLASLTYPGRPQRLGITTI